MTCAKWTVTLLVRYVLCMLVDLSCELASVLVCRQSLNLFHADEVFCTYNALIIVNWDPPPPTWGNPGATRGFRFHFFSKVPWLESNSPPQGLNYIWLRGAHSCEHCTCAWAVTKSPPGTFKYPLPMESKVD